jgi:hypothetical protein
MKQETVDNWINQAEKVLMADGFGRHTQAYHFALSFLTMFYGASSLQVRALTDSVNAILKHDKGTTSAILAYSHGAIRSAIDDIRAGLVVDVRAQIQGEILGDLVMFSKDTLNDNADSAMHVAAVLIAAAFEDVLRRLASEKAGLIGRPKLEQVITTLKDADLLKGGEVSTANSYLKFRNDSLHADWAQVHRFQVEGCISFVESLLLKHFS